MSRPTVLLLTERELPGLGPDDRWLLEALERKGADPVPVIWDGPVPDGGIAIIRSTWDYADRLREFADALERIAAGVPLWNPPETVRWNADKRYLLELAEAGIPVPPAVAVAAGEDRPVATVVEALGGEVVVKPLVGAGGYDTVRLTAGKGTLRGATGLDGELLVQRFVPAILDQGEWSLIFFGGSFSHAVIKHPGGGDFRVQQKHGGAVRGETPPAGLLVAAERVLETIPLPWLYARVDGVWDRGGFQLMELELIEPELFFRFHPGAADRLAGLLLSRS